MLCEMKGTIFVILSYSAKVLKFVVFGTFIERISVNILNILWYVNPRGVPLLTPLWLYAAQIMPYRLWPRDDRKAGRKLENPSHWPQRSKEPVADYVLCIHCLHGSREPFQNRVKLKLIGLTKWHGIELFVNNYFFHARRKNDLAFVLT